MFGTSSGTAPDYHELNAGAHRKPPKVLSAPSLVWHLAFWTSFPELDAQREPVRNADGSVRKKDSQEIRDGLDQYIIALGKAIAEQMRRGNEPKSDPAGSDADGEADIHGRDDGVRLTPCISGAYLLFGHAYAVETLNRLKPDLLDPRQKDIFESTTRTVALQFVWRQLDVSIRFEVRTEYFTISTFVELDRNRVKARDKKAMSSIQELNECIESILNYLEPARQRDAALQSASDASSPAPDSDQLVGRINKYCFHTFWKTYEQEILSAKTLNGCADKAIFQHIFADFRGVVASDQAVRFPDDEFFKADKSAKWGPEAKKKFLPLIQHRDRVASSRYECAVNYMLDGRALYMSTLGPQLLHPSMSEAERIPVEFIVYAHQRFGETTIVNKWQLGRLVSQILLLCTLRLCALKDVKSLHDAGRRLGQLEQSTQAARDAIASTEVNAEGNLGEFPKEDRPATPSDRTVLELIGKAHEYLNGDHARFSEHGERSVLPHRTLPVLCEAV
jgi:hypothetical protein